jgi:TatD DNase family protein
MTNTKIQFIDTHTHHLIESKDVILIKNYFPKDSISSDTFFSVGIHPWYIDLNTSEADIKLIEIHFKNQNCIAIGECGLDRAIKFDYQFQKSIFIKQLKLAQKHKKPAIIHSVKAYQDIINIIKTEKITIPIVFHGFSKNQHIHSVCLKIPTFYFSFGKSLLNSSTTQKNLLATPLNRIFLETDDSKVAIEYIYQKASLIKNISIESLKKQLFLNFQNVFNVDLKEKNGEKLA